MSLDLKSGRETKIKTKRRNKPPPSWGWVRMNKSNVGDIIIIKIILKYTTSLAVALQAEKKKVRQANAGAANAWSWS